MNKNNKLKGEIEEELNQAADNPNWKQEQRRRAWRERRWRVGMFFRGIFWRVLFFLHLNRFVAENMCRLNIYPKYSLGGRCHWCGMVHGRHWKIERPNYGGIYIDQRKKLK